MSIMPPPSHRKRYWFIIHNNTSVLIKKDDALPNDDDILSITSFFNRHFYIGQAQAADYFCAEIENAHPIPETFKAIPLKQALSLIHPERYAMGVKAYSVIHWDKNHQFCGRCGTMTKHQLNAFERFCSRCNISFFPRISPSIIVLIYKDDQLVMARSPHFPEGAYGLIAGFIEVGESAEETIRREVQEEVGLNVKNISYFGSQPWPFPDSLMIAFTAEYASGEIRIDQDEIEDAGWYRYDNLPGRPSSSISIASKLLDSFIQQCKEKELHHHDQSDEKPRNPY